MSREDKDRMPEYQKEGEILYKGRYKKEGVVKEPEKYCITLYRGRTYTTTDKGIFFKNLFSFWYCCWYWFAINAKEGDFLYKIFLKRRTYNGTIIIFSMMSNMLPTGESISFWSESYP